MCGIIGYTGFSDAKGKLIKGLKSLEYRGYDSAGIALERNNGTENQLYLHLLPLIFLNRGFCAAQLLFVRCCF